MRGVLLVLQVGIELVQRAARAQRLVNQRAGGERADVGVGSAALEGLAGQKETALELVGVAGEVFGRSHERLANDGQGSQCEFAQHFARNRNIAPASHSKPRAEMQALKRCGVALGSVFVLRQEQHADGQRLLGAQRNTRLAEQKIARNGGLHANAVAAFAVGGNGAAMREAAKSGQSKAKDFVVGLAVQGRNEAHSAGVVVEARAYEVPATRRKAATTHSPLYMESGRAIEEGIFRSLQEKL